MSDNREILNIDLHGLLNLSDTDRDAKAYAFLYAAFRRTEISTNPVKDALDCLIPFIAPHINDIAGKQVLPDAIQVYLKTNYGFNIPLYAIEQNFPALQRGGYIDFNRVTRRYVAKKHENLFIVAKNEIETQFDEVAGELADFARAKGFPAAPPSGTWGEALINFLKTRKDKGRAAVANIKGAIVDTGKIEEVVVGSFVSLLHQSKPHLFNKIVNIFMGVLVEEFISSVAEIGDIDRANPVVVFYDTAVLLRLLGCSGKRLGAATEELTRYLQDIGFRIYFLSGNESEVAGILDALVFNKDSGRELEGETADAISDGDVTITDIRMLQNSFVERLATFNVFPADMIEKSAFDNARYQIDENGFSEYLKQQAISSRRAYSVQNRENDSAYLGTIMRLRKRLNTRDLSRCGFVFVTTNNLLAQASRRYLIEEKVIQPAHCPPFLTVGQIATIAWLLKDHRLVPEKAGRDLLANCFAAIRPDHEWFRFFREGVERRTGNLEEFVREPRNALILQAARRIAQEESFGSSAIVRELNMVEILRQAEEANEVMKKEADAKAEADREAAALAYDNLKREADVKFKEAEIAAATEKHVAIREAIENATNETRTQIESARRIKAQQKAEGVINVIRGILVIVFVVISVASLVLQLRGFPSMALWVTSGCLLLISVISFMDLLRIPIAESAILYSRNKIADLILRLSV